MIYLMCMSCGLFWTYIIIGLGSYFRQIICAHVTTTYHTCVRAHTHTHTHTRTHTHTQHNTHTHTHTQHTALATSWTNHGIEMKETVLPKWMMSELNWSTLQHCRKLTQLILLFKLLHWHLTIPDYYLPSPSLYPSTRSYNNSNFYTINPEQIFTSVFSFPELFQNGTNSKYWIDRTWLFHNLKNAINSYNKLTLNFNYLVVIHI